MFKEQFVLMELISVMTNCFLLHYYLKKYTTYSIPMIGNSHMTTRFLIISIYD